ncbi:hypothetical protein B0H13DRAFT_2348350 [Mycena leptocephala]|nr:hypothetical protein B0H13DRAFT_2348350 [Mycena leptocephala]
MIIGAVTVSPIVATAITGSTLTLDTSGQFSTSAQVIGRMYAADYAMPTPLMLTTTVNNMGTTFTDATSRVNSDFANLGSNQSLLMLLIILRLLSEATFA